MPSVTQISLSRLIDKIRANEIRIPVFQREYVWNPGQVIDVLESIRTGIPLGAIVLWDVPNRYFNLFENYFKLAPRGGIKKIIKSQEWQIETIPSGTQVFNGTPNNFEGILDGRQRTESLLMAIGGVTYGFSTNPHARIFYLDLTKMYSGTECPFGRVKVAEIETGGQFDTLSKWIAAGKFPLWYTDPNFFIGQLSNPAHYQGPVPSDVGERIQQLSSYLNSISSSSLAVISIENTYDLSQVCSIFETLNISGTKVSAFDITCSNLIGNSGVNEPMNLRERLSDIARNEIDPAYPLVFFSRWCEDSNKWTIISQCVTMMYILSESKQNQYPVTTGINIDSLKGESLINTPELFYREIFDYENDGQNTNGLPSLNLLESFAFDFYNVTNGCANIKTCPYPIIFTQYLGLRYKIASDNPCVTVQMLNEAFRVFYWRISINSRYDQGYLSQATTDAKNLWEFLSNVDNLNYFQVDKQQWWDNLNRTFSAWNLRLMPPAISDLDLDLESNNTGAKQKTYNALLFVKKPIDLKTGVQLNSFDSNVELHHIFPKNWIKNNANNSLNTSRLNFPTALIPLSKTSNLEWLASAPEQKVSDWHPNHNWQSISSYFSSVLTDEASYNPLVNAGIPQTRLDEFFSTRKNTLRNALIILTDCRDLPPDYVY
jgi:hypothetical protein